MPNLGRILLFVSCLCLSKSSTCDAHSFGLQSRAPCVRADRSLQELRGGNQDNSRADHGGDENRDGNLMSAPTAAANVMLDLYPNSILLSIAYGMAASGGTGPVVASLVVFFFALLSWYSLISFARAAEVVLVQTGEKEPGQSLSAVWARTLPFGQVTAFIPDFASVVLTVGCLLFYSVFIGDMFGSLAATYMPRGSPLLLTRRWSLLLLLHYVLILPLCQKKRLSALKYSTWTGIAGMLYTVFFMGKRLVDGSYAKGGKYYPLMPARHQPNPQIGFPSKGPSLLGFVTDIPPLFCGKGILILLNMCFVAYACQYNAVKYYMELKHRHVSTQSRIMAAAVGGTALLLCCMMIMGYGTFGSHCQQVVFDNFHSTDTMAIAARFSTGLATISSYPLVFAGLKTAMFSLSGLDGPGIEKREQKQSTLSSILLVCISIVACHINKDNMAALIGIVGNIFGSIVVYMLPAIISNSLLKMTDSRGRNLAEPFFKGEVIFNNLLIIFGIVCATVGTWVSLREAR